MAIEFKDNSKAKINSDYKPSDKIQFDRRQVYSRFTDMKNARYVFGKNLEDIWDKHEKQYEAWRPAKSSDDWQSNIVPPFTTMIIERALSEIVGQTVRPSVIGRGEEDKYKAQLMNYIVDYTWEIGNGDLELAKSLKQMLVLGTTVWQEDYYMDKREVKLLKKFNPEKGVEEYEKKTIYDFNDVYGETVDIRDFFIDPAARSINNGRYKAKDAVRRYVMDYDMFMEAFKDSVWDQFGATRFVRPGAKSDYYRYYEPTKGMKQNEVELLFYWGRVPDKQIIVANDVVIRDGPNMYAHKQLPFASGTDVDRLVGFWGRGESELLESIQDELTTLRRMRIDRQHLDIFKPTFISNRELLEEDENYVHPAAFIPVDDPNSVKTMDYADINPSAYREEELLKEDGRQVTGVMNPTPSGTATEAAIFRESTMKTLQMKIWKVSRELVTDIIRLRVPNIVQYYSVPMVENVIGDKNAPKFRRIMTQNVSLELGRDGSLVEKQKRGWHYFDIKPEDIRPTYGKYDLKMSAEPSLPLSKPLRQQKVTEFMTNPVTQAAIQSGYYELGLMADVLSEEYDFDPDKFKPKSEEEQQTGIPPEMLIEMANTENEQMMNGQLLPGTPYAPKEHTAIHLSYMDSDDFKQAVTTNQAVAEAFVKHVMEEDRAQQLREQGSPEGTLGMPQQGPAPISEQQGIMQGEMKSASPNRILGKEMVPEGML